MATAEGSIVSVEQEMTQTLRTARLEQVYERGLQRSEVIYEEEKARVLKVQLLLLEDENFDLQEQLAEAEDKGEQLEDSYEQSREQLVEAQAQLTAAQNELKTRLREVENYRTELQALQNISADSTKLLTEKLALSRELFTLKPELEHLKSQAAANQNALSEKLALQREVNSLQVELETERRAVQRMKTRDNKSTEHDTKAQEQLEQLKKELTKGRKESEKVEQAAQTQLEELKKELAQQKKENQKMEHEARKQAAEWETQKSVFESKLQAFRDKLRSTKDQLKEKQEVLEKSQAVAKAAPKPSAIANARKRPVARFDPDLTIGTPGESHAAKRARISTAPGEKSTFSITPFLNKTTSILMDSPDSAKDDPEPAIAEEDSPAPNGQAAKIASSPVAVKTKAARNPAVAKEKPRQLQEATGPRVNAAVGPNRKPLSKMSLPKVTEESDEENEPTAESTTNRVQPHLAKKKQKVLGGKSKSTIFDEDDAEQPKPRARTLFTNKAVGLRGGGLSLTAKPRSLAEFSPLKKDRKSA